MVLSNTFYSKFVIFIRSAILRLSFIVSFTKV